MISKGSTPAGMHLSICVDEILEFLQIQPGQRGLDATLGYGGHSRRMLEKLEGSGHLYGLDVDPIEIVKTETRIRERVWSGYFHSPENEFCRCPGAFQGSGEV